MDQRSFFWEAPGGSLERQLNPMVSRRPELAISGSPSESDKRPVQLGKEGSIAWSFLKELLVGFPEKEQAFSPTWKSRTRCFDETGRMLF